MSRTREKSTKWTIGTTGPKKVAVSARIEARNVYNELL